MPMIEISDEVYSKLKRMADEEMAMITASVGEPYSITVDEFIDDWLSGLIRAREKGTLAILQPDFPF